MLYVYCKVVCYPITNHHVFAMVVECVDISNFTGKRLESGKSDLLIECGCWVDFSHFYMPGCDARKLCFVALVKSNF